MVSKHLWRIRLSIIFIAIISTIIIALINNDGGNVMIIGVVLLSIVLILATTSMMRILRLFGSILLIILVWLGLFEWTINTLNENCIIRECSPATEELGRNVRNYSNFLQTLYPEADWIEPFSIELATMIRRKNKVQFHPYVGFREAPYEGEYAYIDKQGLRPVPQSVCHNGSYNLVTMGNSAIWGQYEPNDQTLAALIHEKVSVMQDRDVCLINHTQGAWNSTQSVIQLVNLIQEDTIPDLVIFYEGAVDVLATSNYNGANIPLTTREMARRIGSRVVTLTPEQQLEYWLRSTNIMRNISVFLKQNNTLPTIEAEYNEPYYLAETEISIEIATQQTVDLYIINYELVELLARQYGFEFLFFVQPVSFYGEKQLTPKEQLDIKDGWPGRDKEPLYEQVYTELKSEAETHPNLYFLGDIFDDYTEEIYVDPLHPLPYGTQIIAEEIGNTLESRLNTQ